jgi:hypothetical protein
MIRIDAVYTGLPGLPGVSGFYFAGDTATQADLAVENVKSFFTEYISNASSPLSVVVQPQAVGVNAATGDVFDFFVVDGQTLTAAGVEEPVTSASQINIRYVTGGVVNNRRVIGRALVPGLRAAFTSDGGLAIAATAAFTTLAETTLGDSVGRGQHVVWSRPTETRVGTMHDVTSYSCQAKFAVLRSRRD